MPWAAIAIAFWVLVGFAAGAAAFTAWHVRLGKRLLREHDPISFGYLLDRECDVLKGDGEWHRGVVVAVSHKGAIAVRNVGDGSGKHAAWVPKDEVSERVRF